jgi:hypothetical protein
VADLLVGAVRAGGTSGEILGGIGIVLRTHRALRAQLNESTASAWDAVMADVDRAFPGSRLAQWLAWFTRRSRGRPPAPVPLLPFPVKIRLNVMGCRR